jgi:hypothetical protein
MVKRPRRGANHPPLLVPRSRKSRAIPQTPLWTFVSVTGYLCLINHHRVTDGKSTLSMIRVKGKRLGKNCVINYGWRCGHAVATLTIHADHINHYRNADLPINAHSLEYRNGALLVYGTEVSLGCRDWNSDTWTFWEKILTNARDVNKNSRKEKFMLD